MRGVEDKVAFRRDGLRLILELILFFLLVVMTTLMLRPAQQRLIAKIEENRDALFEAFEDATDLRITYSSMGPSIFRSIDLRNLKLISPDGVELIAIPHLRLGYSFRALLLRQYEQIIRFVDLDEPRIRLDGDRDLPLLSKLSLFVPIKDEDREDGPDSGSAAIAKLLSLWGGMHLNLEVRIRNADLQVRAGGGTIDVGGLNLTVAAKGGSYAFGLSAKTKIDTPLLPEGLEYLSASIAFDGVAGGDLRKANGRLVVNNFDSGVLAFDRQTILIRLEDDTLSIDRAADRLPFDASIRMSLSEGDARFEVVAEGLSLDKTVVIKPMPKVVKDTLQTARLSGRMNGSYQALNRWNITFDTETQLRSSKAVPLDASVNAAGSLSPEGVRFGNLSIKSDLVEAAFSGSLDLQTLSPSGALHIQKIRLPDGESASGDLLVHARAGTYRLTADSFLFGSLTLGALDLSVVQDAASWVISASGSRYGGVRSDGSPLISKLGCEATIVPGDPFAQLSLSIDSWRGQDILAAATPFLEQAPDTTGFLSFLQNMTLSTELFITSDFKQTSYNAPRMIVSYSGADDHDIVVLTSLDGTNTRIALRDMNLRWPKGSASGSIELDIAELSDIAFSFQARYLDIPYTLEGVILDGRSASFHGDYGLEGFLQLAPDGRIAASTTAKSLPIPIDGFVLNAAFSADGRWTGPSDWNLNVPALQLSDPGGHFETRPRIDLSGTANSGSIDLSMLRIQDLVGVLQGKVAFHWTPGADSFTSEFSLTSPTGPESYEGSISGDKGAYTLDAKVKNGRLGHIINDTHSITVSGDVQARLEDKSYSAKVRVSTATAEVSGEKVELSFSADLSPSSVSLADLSFDYMSYALRKGTLQASSREGSAETSFALRGDAGGLPYSFSTDGHVTFRPLDSWASFSPTKSLESVACSFTVPDFHCATIEPDPFKVTLEKDRSLITVAGGPSSAIRLLMDLDTDSFSVFLAAPLPIRGSVVGSITDGNLDAHASGLYVDFPSMWSIIPIPEVKFTGGIITGQIDITGPLGDPEFNGTVRASGMSCLIPDWVSDEIKAAETNVTFKGKEFIIPTTQANSQAGGGVLSGRFLFDRWIPSLFDLQVQIPSARPIRAKSSAAGVIASGLAAGALSIGNLDGPLAVKGNLTISNTTIGLDTKALLAAQNTAIPPMEAAVDLKLKTGRKVEFVWPSTSFPILRGYADAGDTIGISWNGATGRYAIVGDVDLRGGEVFYVQRSFYIREGSIKFNESEVQFDPLLSVRAEIRERNDEGPVTVSLVANEERLTQFTPRLESDPTLSQVEIISLLGGNLMSANDSGSTTFSESVIGAGSDILAQFNIVRAFESWVRDALNLDMFSVRTQLIQNAFLGAAGIRTVDTSLSLGNYFDNTTVYIGKFIGSSLFVQAMLRAQIDETKTLLGGVTLEPDISMEWKTPFFLLEWNFFPSDLDKGLNSLFIGANSFTFTWKRSL